ncbi:beta-lactamase domain-containing protein [Alcaligenes faecalis subsp. faecalis NCIB 8687]|uniref:Hydrolase n=1 Tax=Alcaligenes faecalis TaxID=511 RepID=Q6WB42_ALCFA|nr:hydrolase [Alcaligenes faecalis subsp. faecalis NCIB 8687]EJC61047.1 beta-lactamase domain-containing protein [Alcaligenes faecalis subsp. faecalis NCIB 8687]EJC61980.1 beta-lactamase domain-containing protein [Alcaligenes faecalis subsp. faecalis NCIB 8687]
MTAFKKSLLNLIAFAAFFGLMATLPTTAAPPTFEPVAQQVVDNVYAIVGPLGQRSEKNAGLNANYGFIVANTGVILIDSGPSEVGAAIIEKTINAVTPKPILWVLNTGSQDHRWLGNGYFSRKGAEIHAMRGTANTQEKFSQQQLTNLEKFLGDQLIGTEPEYASVLHDSPATELSIDGIDIQWIETNAHYPADTMIFLPKHSVVFTGDLVYVDRLLGILPQSNIRNADAAFKQLVSMKPTHVVPGHGRVTDIAQAQKETGDYYTFMITNIGAAAREMEPMTETLNQFANPAQFKHLANFEELHRLNMNRVYLDFESNP